MIVMALGFPAAVALFLLLMGWLEAALFPGQQAPAEPVHRPRPVPGPAPLEDRP